MKIVLDTNVLVSGLLSPHGQPATLLNLIVEKEINILLDERILDEYSEVLMRPRFKFNKNHIHDLLIFLDSIAEWIIPAPLKITIPDPDDLPFLEVALSGHANALVTGNKKDYGSWIQKAVIMTPTEFFTHYKSFE